MGALEIYEAALKEYRNKNDEKALEILEEFNKIAPDWSKAILLEAYIRRDQELFFTELDVLERFFAVTDIEQEEVLAADAYNLLGSVLRHLGRSAEAVNCFLASALLGGKQVEAYPEVHEELLAVARKELSNAIFTANDVENFSAAEFEKLYAVYRRTLSAIQPYEKIPYNHKKLRIGYLSADFCAHPVIFWASPLLFEYDKNLFDVYCYSARKNSDIITERIKNTTIWRDISELTDAEAAKIIRADEIDILFEFGGHTKDNRLAIMAYRPAAVQISGIGYMNSTGLNCVDYFLSDEICAENLSAMQEFFTEKIICMPHSHFCYTPIKKMPTPKIAPCISKGFITFGCFNNFSKVTDLMLSAWKKILDAVPNSKLILKHQIFDTSEGKDIVVKRLQKLGLEISRVELRPYSEDYLEQYGEIDIALDTFPYNGGLTTCEALYMGVPVISLYGDRHGTRFGLSILKNIGLEELAVSNLEDYIQRAAALAADKDLLQILRRNLRGIVQKSHLMNSQEYIGAIEKFYLSTLEN